MRPDPRTLGLVASMAVGLACPQLHRFAWAIRPGIMAMLFLAFFAMPRTRSIVHPAHLRLLLAGPLLALLVFLALRPFDVDLAVAGALVALTPSATASPVVTALLGGDADWVGVSVLLTNSVFPLLAALCLPPLLGGRAGHGWIGPPLATLATLAVPALLAVAGRRFLPAPVREGILARRGWSFWLWVAVLVPTMAGASDYLHHSGTGWLRASSFAGLSLLLCAAMFALGRRLGGKGLGLEASQAFGQKNTLFSLWFAAAYLSPGISLAPAAYVLWHNLWNAWQLQRVRRPPSPSPKD